MSQPIAEVPLYEYKETTRQWFGPIPPSSEEIVKIGYVNIHSSSIYIIIKLSDFNERLTRSDKLLCSIFLLVV